MRLSQLYPEFWAIFKIADAAKRDLFSASRIGPVNFFARPAGISGANFVAGLTRTGALVQCEVMFNTRKADREILLQLASAIEERRDHILRSLGPDYTLERVEHALSLRRSLNNQGNILLKQSWEILAESLVTEIYRVYDVMSPLIEDSLVVLRSPEDKAVLTVTKGGNYLENNNTNS